jgi:replicative DNA helicase
MNSKLNINEALKEVEIARDYLVGIPSGYEDLDKITNGFQRGNLYILAGRPAMGKSALAISIARNTSVDYANPIAYFTLEQGEVQITNRLISAESEIALDRLYKGNLADYEWEQVVHKTQRLTEAPIYIKDSHKLTTDRLAKEARELVKEGIRLIILDDIQRVSLNEEQRKIAVNREQEVSIVVRELKALAKELKIPILAISQLNRGVEARGGDKRPILSDLRDSGALENDSDMVIFLYRPEYYGIMENEEGMPLQGVAELIVAKNRNGFLDTVQLKFISRYTRFTDFDVREWNGSSIGSFTPVSSLGQKLDNEKKENDGGRGFFYTDFPNDDDAPF